MTKRQDQQQFALATRRGTYINIQSRIADYSFPEETLNNLSDYDLLYRSLCGILFNFGPTSGHPGGSISSGRIVEGLLFKLLAYDLSDPLALEADMISYAAGHKAMGLYAMWALRNECARIARPDLLPEEKLQLRLEDLLGFRKNPTQGTPLFKKFNAKPLDGHPTPQTPFIKLATGASGVGVPASLGLAFGALDAYRTNAPFVHTIEGEAGMTAGRVSEALATAATAQIWNMQLHVDWNQSSIDTDRVTREGDLPGEYVQWTPAEFCYLHDWNVIDVEDGSDFSQILAAQELAAERHNDQPTAIIYRTTKGWLYGIEGRKSHGAGHAFASEEYHKMLEPLEERFDVVFPRFSGEPTPSNIETNNYETLLVIRNILEVNPSIPAFIAGALAESKERLKELGRKRVQPQADLSVIYGDKLQPDKVPLELVFEPGEKVTLRAALGETLHQLNKLTNGGIIGASADLLGSTSISKLGESSPQGFYNSVSNPESRLIATGGICEDCMGAFMAGVSSFGVHIGAGSSYGAFIVALQHITARLHGIGQQARKSTIGEPFQTMIIVCAHAGLKTGEDGATHADPQALQLIQENFPKGILISLTPWDPQELWPLMIAGLKQRPAVLAPFVTRPTETIVDRKGLQLPPPAEAVKGIYSMRKADRETKPYHGAVVLQGSEVGNDFVNEVLPKLDAAGLNMDVYYVASAELFSMLPEKEQHSIFPPELRKKAMGITGFTLPTMYQWVTSEQGRKHTLHAFTKGHYLGSGQAHKVLEEAGLNAESQWQAIQTFAKWMESQA